MSEKKDPPIVEQTFLGGVNVVDFGALRVARGLSKRPHNLCRHLQLSYDHQERRIWCKDCETNLEGFEAFLVLVEHFSDGDRRLRRREEAVAEAEKQHLISRASKAVDAVWRRTRMAPCCKVCGSGLLPEDFANGASSQVDREWERARRARQKK